MYDGLTPRDGVYDGLTLMVECMRTYTKVEGMRGLHQWVECMRALHQWWSV